MQVHIYSLKKQVFKRETSLVNLKTISGEITILDGHRPLIAPFAKGPIRIVNGGGKEEVVETRGGFIEVRPKGQVNILID